MADQSTTAAERFAIQLDMLAKRTLLSLHRIPDEPLQATVTDGVIVVTVLVCRAGAGVTRLAETYPGKFFSPLEKLIWDALEEKPLVGKVIASRIEDSFDSTLRGILSNLIQRKVLVPGDNGGYARATKIDNVVS